MASTPISQLSANEKDQLAVTYAVLVLSGQGAPITHDKIKAVVEAAGLTPNPTLIKAFVKTLTTRNIKDIIGGASAGTTAPAETKPDHKEDKKKDAKEGKDAKVGKDAKDTKDTKDAKDAKDTKNKDGKGKDGKGGKKEEQAPPPPPPPPPPAAEPEDEMDVGGLFE
jgi:ribosomal protein L12E/L44/L45/RPP1/RPP2